jgi:hypothetical protein
MKGRKLLTSPIIKYMEKENEELKQLDELVNSFELEELEERIELGCFSGGSGSGFVLWSF